MPNATVHVAGGGCHVIICIFVFYIYIFFLNFLQWKHKRKKNIDFPTKFLNLKLEKKKPKKDISF